jgi:hypothetical protein
MSQAAATNPAGGVHAVSWRASDGAVASGSLELDDGAVVLRGTAGDGDVVVLRHGLDEIVSVRIGRSPAERIAGQRSIVLELAGGDAISVLPVAGGQLIELSELLAELSSEASPRHQDLVVVVVPLRKGTRARAEELAADGPPFDLGAADLERHHMFVTDAEAIFIFEGHGARDSVRKLLRNPRVVAAATRWRDCVAGPPRMADETFAWRAGPS